MKSHIVFSNVSNQIGNIPDFLVFETIEDVLVVIVALSALINDTLYG